MIWEIILFLIGAGILVSLNEKYFGFGAKDNYKRALEELKHFKEEERLKDVHELFIKVSEKFKNGSVNEKRKIHNDWLTYTNIALRMGGYYRDYGALSDEKLLARTGENFSRDRELATEIEKKFKKMLDESYTGSYGSKNNEKAHKSKAWYRFLQVVYVFVFIIILLISWGLASSSGPHQEFDHSSLSCLNNPTKQYTVNELFLTYNDEKIWKGLCYGDPSSQTVQIHDSSGNPITIARKDIFTKADLTSIPVNYTLTPTYHTKGDWGEFAKVFVISFVVGFIVLQLIKFVLLYILVGAD